MLLGYWTNFDLTKSCTWSSVGLAAPTTSTNLWLQRSFDLDEATYMLLYLFCCGLVAYDILNASVFKTRLDLISSSMMLSLLLAIPASIFGRSSQVLNQSSCVVRNTFRQLSSDHPANACLVFSRSQHFYCAHLCICFLTKQKPPPGCFHTLFDQSSSFDEQLYDGFCYLVPITIDKHDSDRRYLILYS